MNKILDRIQFLFQEEVEEIESKFDFDKIEFFYDFLQGEKCNNFFSKKDSQNILDRHIIESIYYVHLIDSVCEITEKTTICDCGSGMGIPGFFFFCLKKKNCLTLLDSKKKKLFILEQELQNNDSFSNVDFLYERSEECKKKFHIVVSRAFLPYPFCLEMVTNMVKKNGFYLPFLGKKKVVEFEKDFLYYNGFEIKQKIYLLNLKFLGERHFLVLKKMRNPHIGYPRQWKLINREIQKYNEKNSCN